MRGCEEASWRASRISTISGARFEASDWNRTRVQEVNPNRALAQTHTYTFWKEFRALMTWTAPLSVIQPRTLSQALAFGHGRKSGHGGNIPLQPVLSGQPSTPCAPLRLSSSALTPTDPKSSTNADAFVERSRHSGRTPLSRSRRALKMKETC